MSDDTNQSDDGAAGGGEGFKAITSQDELNRIISDRVSRERAKYADYAEVKAKAKKLDDAEAASKSAMDKLTEEISTLKTTLAGEQKAALRSRIQAKHAISDEDAALFLTGEDEATLTRQATALAAKVVDRKKQGNVSPREGITPPQPPDDAARKLARDLFGGGGQ
jgi:hypothetical protein